MFFCRLRRWGSDFLPIARDLRGPCPLRDRVQKSRALRKCFSPLLLRPVYLKHQPDAQLEPLPEMMDVC